MAVGKFILWGLIGGLVGGLVTLLFFFTAPYVDLILNQFTVVIPLLKIARIVDSLFGTGDTLIWGYFGHFFVSTVYGLMFGVFAAVFKPNKWKTTLLLGFLSGIFFTLLGPYLMMPILMNMEHRILDFSVVQSVMLEISIHQAFSFPMAVVFKKGMKNEFRG